jgi:hypothetical protein
MVHAAAALTWLHLTPSLSLSLSLHSRLLPPPALLPLPSSLCCRRFQPVIVDEPTEGEALLILEGLQGRYERHHRVVYSSEAVAAAVALSSRYIPDRYLPDKVGPVSACGVVLDVMEGADWLGQTATTSVVSSSCLATLHCPCPCPHLSCPLTALFCCSAAVSPSPPAGHRPA